MHYKAKGKLPILIILLIMAAILTLLIVLFFRYNVRKSTDQWSSDIPSTEERIAFYQEYVTCPSDILDIAFHITYEDHSKDIVPSASNYEIASIIEVDPTFVPEWLVGYIETEESEINPNWWKDITPDAFPDFSKLKCYKIDSDSMYQTVYYQLVDAEEGTVWQYFYYDKNTADSK